MSTLYMAGFLVRGRALTTTPVLGVVLPGALPPFGHLSRSLMESPVGEAHPIRRVQSGGRHLNEKDSGRGAGGEVTHPRRTSIWEGGAGNKHPAARRRNR